MLLGGLWPPPANADSFQEPLLRSRSLERGKLALPGFFQETRIHGSLIIRRLSVDPFPPPTDLAFSSLPFFPAPSFTWNQISWLAESGRGRGRLQAAMAEKAKKVEGTV